MLTTEVKRSPRPIKGMGWAFYIHSKGKLVAFGLAKTEEDAWRRSQAAVSFKR